MYRQRNVQIGGWFRVVLAGIGLLMASLPAVAGSELATGPASGLPVPRFVSLKPDKVNVRAGPTRNHDVAWQFTRSGLPVEITAESDNWRRIRDWEGSEGWVYHSLLSGRRTALVIAKTKEELVPLFNAADEHASMVAQLQPGVVASVRRCTGRFCHIAGSGFDGWIVQERLWGVYPNEKVD
jgi:SH3-like domain-containing protein